MRRLAVIDGEIRAPEEARVSVYDRGFLYGHAVFEVMRTYGGRPFALDEHFTRLRASAEKALVPIDVSDDVLRAEVESAIDAVREGGAGEAYLRLAVTAGEGVGLAAKSGPSHRVLLVEQLGPALSIEELATTALLVRIVRDADATATRGVGAGTAKVTGYLSTILALADARRLGASDVIVVDDEGHVREGGTSNVFVVARDGTIVTPPLEGVLPGVTRAHVLRLAHAAGLTVVERPVTTTELLGAKEAFLTSTVREIAPIVGIVAPPSVERTALGDGAPGPIARDLLERLRRHGAARAAHFVGTPGR